VTHGILTQRDIDAIMRGGAPPDAPSAADVLPYSFARPAGMSRERRAALESIHGRYAAAVQTMFSSRLRTVVDVTPTGLEQVLFSEFALSLSTPCTVFVFTLGGKLEGSGALDLGSDFAFHLIDRMLGGPGEPETFDRPLTLLEQTVLKSFTERLVQLLRDAWAEHATLAPAITAYTADPESIGIAGRDHLMLVMSLDVRTATTAATVSVCLPMTSLEPFLAERSVVRAQPAARAAHDPARRHVASGLKGARVTVSARLPGLRLTARELARLAEGQVLHTGSTVDAPVEIHVNGRPCWLGIPGQVRRHVALRVSEPISAPEPQRTSLLREGRIL
jgi:flagellar motor switch protein FliM